MDEDQVLLMLGAEGIGKHDIAKYLVNMRTCMNLKIISSCLVPNDLDLHAAGVTFVCFMMMLSSKESFRVLRDCLGKVDISYLVGRSIIIVNAKETMTKECVELSEIQDLAAHYDMPILFGNTEDENERTELCRKLVRITEIACSVKLNVSPMFYESVRVDHFVPEYMSQSQTVEIRTGSIDH